jgi:hypothetical protein
VTKGDIVEIKVTAEIQACLDEFAQPASENAPAGDSPRQKTQWAQKAKRRIFRIVNKITPITMLDGPSAGEDRGNASGAVAKNRGEAFTVGSNLLSERIILDDLPPAGINEYEQRKQGFHGLCNCRHAAF